MNVDPCCMYVCCSKPKLQLRIPNFEFSEMHVSSLKGLFIYN